MTYEQYEEQAKNYVEQLAAKYGGIAKAGEATGIDYRLLVKIRKGRYIPKPKTFCKKFPGFKLNEPVDSKSKGTTIVVAGECYELETLKKQLDLLGYEIIIRKKES